MHKEIYHSIEKKEKIKYLKKVEALIQDMLEISNNGISKFNDEDLLILCGLIRDCAFKIKKKLKN
ncbi:hypothetical protein JCM12298_27410 [Desulfothermus naphthae]